MQRYHCLVKTGVKMSGRVKQVMGMFDIPETKFSVFELTAAIELPDTWNIGAIVGASGSGKSLIAREIFGDFAQSFLFDADSSIIDAFPKYMSIAEVAGILSAVGLSSPPAWLRPLHALSNGEQFRAQLARAIAEAQDVCVVDEFTSVVDRNVAQIASAAVQKYIRKAGKKFVAVSCHYDILDWLEPDWVYCPATQQFYTGRYLHQRQKIELRISRIERSAWSMFRRHHYLDSEIHQAAQCFGAFYRDNLVAFSAVIHFPHPKNPRIKREHRTVCLPDYQGVGIGSSLADYVAMLYTSLGYRYISVSSHPAVIAHRLHSKNWIMTRVPSVSKKTMPTNISKNSGISGILPNRATASFVYSGETIERQVADKIVYSF